MSSPTDRAYCGVLVSIEQRFVRTPDGVVWTNGTFPYSFWSRYLEVFDRVRIVARVRDVASQGGANEAITGPGVEVLALPHYVGAMQYLGALAQLKRIVGRALSIDDATIMRIPSPIACTLASYLWKTGRPYGVEVVADAFDVFAPGSIRHVLRPIVRTWLTRQQRLQCHSATAAAYVTKCALQRRYPCGGLTVGLSDVQLEEGGLRTPFSTHYSSVELDDAAFAQTVLSGLTRKRRRIVTMASLEQPYKGIDVLIDAIASVSHCQDDVELVILGEGKYRKSLEAQAERVGVSKRVHFRGQVASVVSIRAELDAACLFVLPSRTEGLPRAMIEAMARRLPCIGSDVGGIPELLDAADMVPAGDSSVLAAKLLEVLANPTRLMEMADRNFETALQYRDEILHDRRVSFCKYLRTATEAWRAQSGLGAA